MSNKEVIKAIKDNYPPEKYTILREALDYCVKILSLPESKGLETLERILDKSVTISNLDDYYVVNEFVDKEDVDIIKQALKQGQVAYEVWQECEKELEELKKEIIERQETEDSLTKWVSELTNELEELKGKNKPIKPLQAKKPEIFLGICPICKNYIWKEEGKIKYCPGCGRKLDWKGEKND
jgi:DNA repair exonuclease SbcCD ATPase subunit